MMYWKQPRPQHKQRYQDWTPPTRKDRMTLEDWHEKAKEAESYLADQQHIYFITSNPPFAEVWFFCMFLLFPIFKFIF
jgi:hypothetical protein